MHQLDGEDREVALAEHAVAGAILRCALPDDDEVARGVGGHGRGQLGAERVGVDPELRAQW